MESPALFDADAERGLVGCALLSPGMSGGWGVEADDFSIGKAAAAWAAIRALSIRGDSVTPASVSEETRTAGTHCQVQELVEWCVSVPSAESGESLGKIVSARARARALFHACARAIREIQDPSANVDATLTEHCAAIAQIGARASNEPVMLGSVIPQTLEQIEERSAGRKSIGISTGLFALDDFAGTMQPSRQIVIAARPGQGKSALTKVMALSAARSGHPVLIFSLEMPIIEQAERILSDVAGVGLSKLSRGSVDFEGFTKMVSAGSEISSLPIWICDKPVTISSAEAIVRSWHARWCAGKHGLVIVDYLGLVTDAATMSRERHVAQVSMTCKRMAMQFGHTSILASQLNRDLEKERRDPRMSDLRESGAIEQDADMILFPVRDEAQESRGFGEARIVVGKNRSGPTGEVTVKWEGPFTRFSDVSSAPY